MPSWIIRIKRSLQIGLGAALLVGLCSVFLQNLYKSEARILPEDKAGTTGLGSIAAAAAAFGVNVPGGEGRDANFVDILQSRWVSEQLLNTEFEFKVRNWRFGSEQIQKETLYQFLKSKNIDRATKKLSSMFLVSRDPKTKVLHVTMETTSPSLSQQVINKSIALLEKFILEKGRTRGGAKALFAEARLRDARVEMNKAESEFLDFSQVNRNYQVSADPSVRIRGVRLEAELKLHQQLLTTLALNREQSLMEEKNDVPILNVLDFGNLAIDHSWPNRVMFAGLTFLLVFATALSYQNREWISRILDTDDSKDIDIKNAVEP